MSSSLSRRDRDVLAQLTGDPKTTRDIARPLGLSAPNISVYLKRLEAHGLARCVLRGLKGRYPGQWVRVGVEATGEATAVPSPAPRKRSSFNPASRVLRPGNGELKASRADRNGVPQPVDVSELSLPAALASKGGVVPPAPAWMLKPLAPPNRRTG